MIYIALAGTLRQRATLYRSKLLREGDRELPTKSPAQSKAKVARNNRLKAKQHPLRREIWRILSERTASPKQLHDELGANIPMISHHTKRLVQLGLVEEVDKRPVRGAIEHFYRAIVRDTVDDSEWNALLKEDPEAAEDILCANFQLQLDDFTDSLRAGILGSDDRFLVDRTAVIVDEKGQDELLELFDRVEVDEVTAIVRRSAERRSTSGEDAVHMAVNLAIIKTVPPSR